MVEKDRLLRLLRENKVAAFSAVLILIFVLAAVFAPFLAPYDPKQMDIMNRLSAPSAEHLLGTDEGGRDILARMLYGSRVSLLAGVLPTLMSMLLGAALGLISGFAGGIADGQLTADVHGGVGDGDRTLIEDKVISADDLEQRVDTSVIAYYEMPGIVGTADGDITGKLVPLSAVNPDPGIAGRSNGKC